MGTSFTGIYTALSAIQANQKRLDITGHNLSNMNNTGYTRQVLNTSALSYTGNISQASDGKQLSAGFGVKMNSITQIRDPYLDTQYRSQMGAAGYADAMQTGLDALSAVFDESNISGIRQALDDIQSTLTNLQDPAKTADKIYESELRERMNILTNLIKDGASQIETARALEYERLDGSSSSENGIEQKVNDILERISSLNRTIRHNEIFGQPELELTDERNVLLDELASYIPIEVSYKTEAGHENDKDWPKQLIVNAVYKDKDNTTQRILLVNGTAGSGDDNIAKLEINRTADLVNVSASFTPAAAGSSGTRGSAVKILFNNNSSVNNNYFEDGSLQAGLDMLSDNSQSGIRGYDYYREQLDTFAAVYASTVNGLNIKGNDGDAKALLLINGTDPGNPSAAGINASNIAVNTAWVSGTVALGKTMAAPDGTMSPNDTVLAMLKECTAVGHTELGGNTFTGFINNVSTLLATDSSHNQTAVSNGVTLLNSIQDARDSMSGISLDEEAANMITYMSAYNAASRLMTTMDEMLDRLINETGLVGR